MSKSELDHKQRSQIVAAINESLKIADCCLHFSKETGDTQDDYVEQCYGYPAAILLFCIIDTIGAYRRGKKDNILVGSRSCTIKQKHEHFYILNHANYFNCNLSQTEIDSLYKIYRSRLIHNHALPANYFLTSCKNSNHPFISDDKGNVIQVNIVQLFICVSKAVELFIDWFLNEETNNTIGVISELKNINITNHNNKPRGYASGFNSNLDESATYSFNLED